MNAALQIGDRRMALEIVLAQPGDNERFEERQIIIAKISLEARVHRTGDRQPPPPRPRRRLPRHAVGAGNMDDIGREGGDILADRSEEHTSELQSLMRISYAVFCLKKKKKTTRKTTIQTSIITQTTTNEQNRR